MAVLSADSPQPHQSLEHKSCRTCGEQGHSLKRCTRCQAAWYCGIDCQKKDLRRHKAEDLCGTTQTPQQQKPPQELSPTKNVVAGSSPTSGASTDDTRTGGLVNSATNFVSSAASRVMNVLPTMRAVAPGEGASATAAAVAAAPRPRTGPKCMRCQRPTGELKEFHHYVEIVQRSIYHIGECSHGPYCTRCATAMKRQTLPFCHGCGALAARIEAAGKADCKEDKASETCCSTAAAKSASKEEPEPRRVNQSPSSPLSSATTPPPLAASPDVLGPSLAKSQSEPPESKFDDASELAGGRFSHQELSAQEGTDLENLERLD
mmetsp:Transcript_35393/g.53217  ORF Transcript_35393/g.53217 Transcript_35393/m.53217 type:complete len:320 (-) Transcript_35393:222-1181(-)|eukprot:CAMPEP_0206471506 /NCGR_PEP_ID=MMETSP0324_2-20121206/31607_1 /ASSEMBLY_ACC=CAM_ASM_000836 /TAXON_ID=2866 /ORGANISM="Crypthecodinium cohnii, Strain Seligo" /LENGTH=319 /DNA_ID=CAMNT_0053945851 /DNA_START=95 /DNA_END=1054 /DNA_ORIENTATION=-